MYSKNKIISKTVLDQLEQDSHWLMLCELKLRIMRCPCFDTQYSKSDGGSSCVGGGGDEWRVNYSVDVYDAIRSNFYSFIALIYAIA